MEDYVLGEFVVIGDSFEKKLYYPSEDEKLVLLYIDFFNDNDTIGPEIIFNFRIPIIRNIYVYLYILGEIVVIDDSFEKKLYTPSEDRKLVLLFKDFSNDNDTIGPEIIFNFRIQIIRNIYIYLYILGEIVVIDDSFEKKLYNPSEDQKLTLLYIDFFNDNDTMEPEIIFNFRIPIIRNIYIHLYIFGEIVVIDDSFEKKLHNPSEDHKLIFST